MFESHIPGLTQISSSNENQHLIIARILAKLNIDKSDEAAELVAEFKRIRDRILAARLETNFALKKAADLAAKEATTAKELLKAEKIIQDTLNATTILITESDPLRDRTIAMVNSAFTLVDELQSEFKKAYLEIRDTDTFDEIKTLALEVPRIADDIMTLLREAAEISKDIFKISIENLKERKSELELKLAREELGLRLVA